jgi:cytochrome c peroxidase
MQHMKHICGLVIVAIGMIYTACHEHVESADDKISLLRLETLPEVVYPENNPYSEPKRLLGKFLFYDPILSGERDVACVTCHLPDQGYADGIDLSIGVGGSGFGTERIDISNGRIPINGRNAPTIINTAFNGLISSDQSYDPLMAPMFWDGRRKSLETQCIGPPTGFNIMRGDQYSAASTYDSLTIRLKNIPDYQTLFDAAFGPSNSITKENIAKAIATFERTIVSTNSAYDRYVRGEKNALTENQKLGLQLFYKKANCVTCHSGPMFSDYNFYNLGISYNDKRADPDKGAGDKFFFRTPSLRNVELTAPYMHNGTIATLEAVIDHYNAAVSANPDIENIDVKLQVLSLSQNEVTAITDFLRALTDESYDKKFPESVPSGLKPGGN